MPIRTSLLRFLLFILPAGAFLSPVQGQSNSIIDGKSLMELRHQAKYPALQPSTTKLITSPVFLMPGSKPSTLKPNYLMRGDSPRIPAIYSYDDLALFCKLEVQLERAFRMPVKVRLGDVQYVDWLEGKREMGAGY